MVPTDGGQERGHVNVRAHDGIEHPFETEVGYAFEAVLEGVDACDGDGRGWGETFAGEEAEQGRFARAVGCSRPQEIVAALAEALFRRETA